MIKVSQISEKWKNLQYYSAQRNFNKQEELRRDELYSRIDDYRYHNGETRLWNDMLDMDNDNLEYTLEQNGF